MTMRILRFFDWRFVLSVAFMMLVASVVFSSWSTAQQRDRLIDQNQHAQAVAASERHEAARERRAILAGQRDLQRKYDGLLAQQKALLVWLRTHGISVPAELIADANADSSTIHSDGHDHHDGTANSGPDNPSSGGSGKASGGSKGSTGGGGGSKSSHGKSGSKSHGQNTGGKGNGHKPHKAKKK